MPILKDGPEIPEEESSEDEHGNDTSIGFFPQAQRIERVQYDHLSLK
jgi:hypothetical protein